MAHHIDRLGRVSFFAVFVAALVLGTPAHAAKLLSGYIGNMPKISGTPTTSVVAGNNYSFQPTASDPNGDPLVFSISKRPSWARFDTATGRLYGVPTRADAGRTRDIVIWVSDGKYAARLPRFTLRVSAGTAPTISGSPLTTVSAGTAYDFKPVAADPDGQALTFAVINKPTWANFDTATGRLSGTPGTISAGTYSNVGISVTDGSSTASLAPFTITVTAQANTPPTISGTPATSVQVGNAYDFRPTASDANGNALRFSIVNPPSWATFDTATGRLSGTPQSGNVGTSAQIVMSVTDNIDVTFLPMFSITVTAPPPVAPTNNPPTISGTPSTSGKAGQPYAFSPTATDPDGQTLTHHAEEIKLRYACALSQLANPDETIEVPSVGDRPARRLARQTLAEVVEPRYEELFALVYEELRRSGFDQMIAAGVVLTGGSAKMEGVIELAEEVFHAPVRLGLPQGVSGLVDVVRNPIHSTGTGLLLFGRDEYMRRGRTGLGKAGRTTLERMKEWFKGNF